MVNTKGLSASSEDYLEAIYQVCQVNKKARSRDIVGRLGVSGSSVTEALQLLNQKGLVNYVPYEPITLTSQGESVVCDILYRHETLKEFFVEVLRVDKGVADEGACKMEHGVSSEVIERIVQYTKYLRDECKEKKCPKHVSFEAYLKGCLK